MFSVSSVASELRLAWVSPRMESVVQRPAGERCALLQERGRPSLAMNLLSGWRLEATHLVALYGAGALLQALRAGLQGEVAGFLP